MKKIYCHNYGLLFLVLFLSSVLINGCGNSKRESEGESGIIPTTQAATVGLDVCTNCHYGQTQQWLVGQHGNMNAIDHTTFASVNLGLESDGFPYYGYEGLGTDPNCTTMCHDPLGDGKRLTAGFTGNVERPVIGCESCHGGGGQHFGTGPIAYATPDQDRCGQCHSSAFPDGHLTYHPNGKNIVEEFKTSKHFASITAYALVEGTTNTTVEALCSRCHTDEGYKAYRFDAPATLGHDAISAALDGKAVIEKATPVQCRTCHNSHMANASDLTRIASSGTGASEASSAYNTCTSCHQASDGFHGERSTYSYDTAGAFDPSRIIYDTHFFPTEITGPATGPVVSQLKTFPTYLVSLNTTTLDSNAATVKLAWNSGLVGKSDKESCSASCHNPHSADLTINRQWKAGAHGDPLAPSVDHLFSKACIRCHLSTGYANLWTYPSITAGMIAQAADTTIPVEYQGQLKTCNTCHKGTAFPTSTNKQLRKTGTIDLVAENGTFVGFTSDPVTSKPTYTVKFLATTPDMGNSATCLTCHQGREGGDSVRSNIQALASAGTSTQLKNGALKFINEHYLAAGATLFGGDGHKAFEYIDDTTGLVSSPDTTNNIAAQIYFGAHPHAAVGCVGCHMQITGKEDLGGHSFMMENAAGEINTAKCAECHEGGIAVFDTYRLPTNGLDYDGDGVVAGIHDELEGLKTALINLFAAQSVYYNPDVYPYFHNVATGQSSSTGYSAWNQAQLKAAFNLNTFTKEPGAFAHNGKYAAEILIDAYRDLNGGTLAGSALANAQRP